MAANYSEFKKMVQSFLIDTTPQLEANIPTFIKFAQDELSRVIKFPFDEGVFTDMIVNGIKTVDYPTDALSLKTVSVNQLPYERVDLQSFLSIVRDESPCKKRVFTQTNGVLKFSPELQDNDIIDLIYHKDFPRFVQDNDTNVALEKAEDLLLYLSLRHASIWLRDAEQEQYWTVKANDAAQTLSQTFDEAFWAGSTLRIQNIRGGR